MSIRDRVTADMKTAMKSGDAVRLSTLRLMSAMIKERDIQARTANRTVSEDDLVGGVRGMLKASNDSLKMFIEGGRADLVAKTQDEIAVLKECLPAGPDEATIKAIVAEAIASTGATSLKEQGKVLGAIKAKLGASVDMAQVRTFVVQALT